MCRIVHLTSAHPRNDTRIFIKQCRTLAAHGYDVTLVVADDKGDAHIDGVAIADVGRLSGRLNRIIKTTRRVFDKAVALDADIYQLHDPELLPIGLALKRRGKKVIFDSHEDVPRQLLSKPCLGPLSGRVLSAAFSLVQFHPLPNHLDSLPTKMFEYMSSGIPVIASDFPLWRTIIEGNQCGLCVDPLDPKAIAAAIDYLVKNPDVARSMGENGRRAVLTKYNWSVQAKKGHRFLWRYFKC